MLKYVNVAVAVSAALSLTACKTLEEWTEARGYQFDNNYSDRQLLGSQIAKTSNGYAALPFAAVTLKGDRGSITDFNEKSDSQFKIDGSAKVSQVLNKITNADLSGELTNASTAEFSVKGPYKLLAKEFIPNSPCNGEVAMAYDVLNTGKLSIQLKNSTGAAIDASAAIGKVDPKIGVKYNNTTQSIETGDGMFVGFIPYNVKCSSRHDSVVAPIDRGYVRDAYKNLALYVAANAVRKFGNGSTDYEASIILQNVSVPALGDVAELSQPIQQPGPGAEKNADALRQTVNSQIAMRLAAESLAQVVKTSNLSPDARAAIADARAKTPEDPFETGTRTEPGNATVIGSTAAHRIVRAGDTLRLGGADGQPLHLVTFTAIDRNAVTAEVDTIVFRRGDHAPQ